MFRSVLYPAAYRCTGISRTPCITLGLWPWIPSRYLSLPETLQCTHSPNYAVVMFRRTPCITLRLWPWIPSRYLSLPETLQCTHSPNYAVVMFRKVRCQSELSSQIYRVIQNDCRGFNNLPYTVHFR